VKRRRPRNLLWILGGYGFAAPYLVLFLLFLVLPLVFGLVLSSSGSGTTRRPWATPTSGAPCERRSCSWSWPCP
jgi:ABC-type sugar transport system permease subunit